MSSAWTSRAYFAVTQRVTHGLVHVDRPFGHPRRAAGEVDEGHVFRIGVGDDESLGASRHLFREREGLVAQTFGVDEKARGRASRASRSNGRILFEQPPVGHQDPCITSGKPPGRRAPGPNAENRGQKTLLCSSRFRERSRRAPGHARSKRRGSRSPASTPSRRRRFAERFVSRLRSANVLVFDGRRPVGGSGARHGGRSRHRRDGPPSRTRC